MSPKEILALQEEFADNESKLQAKAATVTVRALSAHEPPRVLVDSVKSTDIASANDSLIVGMHGGLLLGITVQAVTAQAPGSEPKRWLNLHDWSGNKTGAYCVHRVLAALFRLLLTYTRTHDSLKKTWAKLAHSAVTSQ